MSFDCLYYLTSDALDVIEIKRRLPEGTPPAQLYQWLLLPKRANRVMDLDFKSMRESGEQQVRVFQEGELHFDAVRGHLVLFNQRFDLQLKAAVTLPIATRSMIAKHLENPTVASGHEAFYYRPLRPADMVLFSRWIFDVEVTRFSLTSFHTITNVNEARAWFLSTLFDASTFQYGLVDTASNQLIGYVGVARLNPVDKNGEFFIFIGDKAHWNRGIANHATRQITTWAFERHGLHRVYLTASSKNEAGLKAYRKAGYVEEGRMREAFFRGGEFSDKIVMGLLKRELA